MPNCECSVCGSVRPQWGGMVMPAADEIPNILSRYTALQIQEDPLLLYLQAKLAAT
jgi:hypothetical protein